MPHYTTEYDLEIYRRRLKQPARATIAPQNKPVAEDKAIVLLRDIGASGLPGIWYREFTFHESRGWRLDVACPEKKLSVEIDGQIHRIRDKFARDMERHNALQILGWRYIRVTPAQVDNGEALMLLEALMKDQKARSTL